MVAPASIIFKNGDSGHGRVFLRATEVAVSQYSVEHETDGLKPGDVFIRIEQGAYGGKDIIVQRLVELSEEEAALVQAGMNQGYAQARNSA